MQNKTMKETQTPKTGKKRQIKVHESADTNAAPENQQKNRSKEAKAAIANANLQSRAEVNAQFTRQQFFNSQLYMQQMMQMQVWQMQQARQMEHQQHQHQEEDVEKQSQPPKKRGRTKGGPKTRMSNLAPVLMGALSMMTQKKQKSYHLRKIQKKMESFWIGLIHRLM